MSEHINWLDGLRWQIDFSRRAAHVRRRDPEFEWAWYGDYLRKNKAFSIRALIGRMARRTGVRPDNNPFSRNWLEVNAVRLWGARRLLEDDLSRLLFDLALVLRSSSFEQFYFPRIEFENFVEIVDVSPFNHDTLPQDYLGLPLAVYRLKIPSRPDAHPLSMITTATQIRLLNSYRQYLIRRGTLTMAPVPGDVVMDCGACIGEVSLLFASLASPHGQIHLFDPVPLHLKYCELQAAQNPSLGQAFRINHLAVGGQTRLVAGGKDNSDRIAPGGMAVDSFAMTTLDDYAASMDRVDVIKMDIEGAELEALDGAAHIIRRFTPRMSISAYHRPEDLWELPDRIKSLNGSYRLFFGHHSPMVWESVYYAHV